METSYKPNVIKVWILRAERKKGFFFNFKALSELVSKKNQTGITVLDSPATSFSYGINFICDHKVFNKNTNVRSYVDLRFRERRTKLLIGARRFSIWFFSDDVERRRWSKPKLVIFFNHFGSDPIGYLSSGRASN